jgi:hypothetical protein
VSNKEILVEQLNQANEGLQCDLVGNEVIDNLMLKLSVEQPKMRILDCSTKSVVKIRKPKMLDDYIDILKTKDDSPIVADVDKGDTITVSSDVSDVTLGPIGRVKSLFVGPFTFLRENMLVITSVPAFFVALLCLYGLIVLVIKPL